MTESAAPQDSAPPGPVTGFLADLGHLLTVLTDALYTRLELLLLDLQEGSAHLLGVLLWALIGLLAAAMTLLLGALALIFIFWDTHRILVALLLTGLFGAFALAAALVVIAKLRARHGLFAATLEEFRQDRQHLNIQP
ncbi:MAG: phage holin family protein [Steroidobacteraceae bacterium]